MKTGKKIAYMALLALAGAACADKPQTGPTDVTLPVAVMDVMDGVSELLDGSVGGHPDFLWFPPVVSEEVTPPGPLATGLSPLVEICDRDFLDPLTLDPEVSCSTNTAMEEDDHYHFGFKNGIETKPSERSPYRVRIFGVEGYLLGSFVVHLNSNKNIPLKFWIGEGFSQEEAQGCLDDDRCNLGTVVDAAGGTVVTTVIDPDGGDPEEIAAVTFPPNWAPDGVDRTVIIDCRNDIPSEIADDMTGPLNTHLTQLPWYCDFSLDPPLPEGLTFNEPGAFIEVCETITNIHGESALGKSSGDADFEILRPLPDTHVPVLLDCDVNYPGGNGIPEGSASRLWDQVTSRLARVFRIVGPQPLRANMRDGGAGGVAISFSAINPVIPAVVEVTVEGSDAGLVVTLTKGEDVVAMGETDASGVVTFGRLDVGDYEVTVEDTGVEYEQGLSQSVDVFASRPFPEPPESPPFEVFFTPVSDDEPTIVDIVPATPALGQLVTLFVENINSIESESGVIPLVVVTFHNNLVEAQAEVITGASSASQIYVEVPSNIPVGNADIRLQNLPAFGSEEPGPFGPRFFFTIAGQYGTPEIVEVPGGGGGFLGPDDIAPDVDVRVQVYGLNGNTDSQICYTVGSEPGPEAACGDTGSQPADATGVTSQDDNRFEVFFPVPDLGIANGSPVWIRVRQSSSDEGQPSPSEWSAAHQVTYVVVS